MKLHHALRRHIGADPQRTALRVHAQNAADQEIAGAEFAGVGAHRHAQVQGLAEQLAVRCGQAFEHFRQHVARRAPVELADQILMRRGHEHRIADGPAALRDHHLDVDVARERERDAAGVIDLVAEI